VFLNAGSRGIFDRCFSNTNALPRINIGAKVWGESNIMTGVYLMLVIVYFAHRMGSV
jgi:hypothetical protein